MKISVITINYNNLSGLKQTISSVLSQTYTDMEYIVIDGGSKDGGAEYIQSIKEKLYYCVSEPDSGIYNAMNKGINVSTGEYVIFMNSGDVFFDKEVLAEIFSCKEYDSDILYGSTIYKYGNEGILRKPRTMSVMRKELPFCHQSCFIKGDLMRERLYNERYKIISDYDFFYHMWREGKSFHEIKKIVSIYDTSGLSANKSNKLKVYKEHCSIQNVPYSKMFFFLMNVYGRLKNLFRCVIPSKLRDVIMRRELDSNICKPISWYKQMQF